MTPAEPFLNVAHRLDDTMKAQTQSVHLYRQAMADLQAVGRSLECSTTGYLASLGRLEHDGRIFVRHVRALEEIMGTATRGAIPTAPAAPPVRMIAHVIA